MTGLEVIVLSAIVLFLYISAKKGFERQAQGLPDKDYEAESRLHKRAFYLVGKNLGKGFKPGTRKRKMHRVK